MKTFSLPSPRRFFPGPDRRGRACPTRCPQLADAALRAPRCDRVPPGFTLIEILVVITLLSIIVLGLLTMFTQTQKAFRTGLTQADVLASGRVATDMIVRELEQITPTRRGAVNFDAWYPNYRPLEQALPGSALKRTNMLEDLFFVTRRNREWIGIGYFVRHHDQTTGAVQSPSLAIAPAPNILSAGTLYRFEATVTDLPTFRGPDYLYSLYLNAAYTNFWPLNSLPVAKVVDGVVNFKIRAYNTNGVWITNDWGANGVSYSGLQTNTDIRISGRVPGEVGQYRFYSNAVPAAVELEIGILEDKAWDRFKGLPTDVAKHNYVSDLVGRVHLFRQRVQVRNVDPLAYQ